MHDQQDDLLDGYYKGKIEEAKSYLRERYQLKELAEDDAELSDILRGLPGDSSEYQFWAVEIEGSWRKFELIVIVPKIFPDFLPRLYLRNDDFEKTKPLAHVGRDRFICTRDPEAIFINEKCCGRAIEELLEIAVKEIVEPGIKRENEKELITEFLAYWNEGYSFSVITMFTPGGNEIRTFQSFPLPRPIVGSKYIIALSAEEANKWLSPYGVEVNPERGEKVMYLPLTQELSADVFYAKHGIALTILGNLPLSYRPTVERYLNEDRDSMFLCSFPLASGHVLFGWSNKKWKEIKGFSRRNRIPLKIRLIYARDDRIDKIKVIRIDKERVLSRGGAADEFLAGNALVSVIGCGSVGSFLCMALARSGVTGFSLIDKQELELENIGRHLCGFMDVSDNMKKVDAVKKALHNQFPGIDCTVSSEDVLDLLAKKGEAVFTDSHLVIVATANLAVERRINYIVKKGLVKCPVAFLWIEPFGVAGHLLYLSSDDGGCYECCLDAEGYFLYSVSKPGQEVSKREAGCQTNFLPVTSIDTELFVSVVTKQIVRLIKKPQGSTLFTWIGDIDSFESRGYKVNEAYNGKSSGTLVVRGIEKRHGCSACVQ